MGQGAVQTIQGRDRQCQDDEVVQRVQHPQRDELGLKINAEVLDRRVPGRSDGDALEDDDKGASSRVA